MSFEYGPAATAASRAATGLSASVRAGVERDLRRTLEMARRRVAAIRALLEPVDCPRRRPVTTAREVQALVRRDVAAEELDCLRPRVAPALSPSALAALTTIELAESAVSGARVAYPSRHRPDELRALREAAGGAVVRAQIAFAHLEAELWEPRVGIRDALRCRLHARRASRSENGVPGQDRSRRPLRRFARPMLMRITDHANATTDADDVTLPDPR